MKNEDVVSCHKAFSRNLRRIRRTRGWSMLDLSVASSVSNTLIGRIELGAGCRLGTAVLLATALNTTVDEMVHGVKR